MMKFIFFILLAMVASLANADNLSVCLSGRFPSLCDKSQLTEAQKRQALDAERSENLKTCLTGKFPSLCRKGLLSADQLKSVQLAEKRENLSTCLTGRYPTICNKSILTNEERVRVAEAEKVAQKSLRSSTRTSRRSSGCETGHWVQEVMADGEFVKLEDGSLWQISPADQVDTMLWLPTTDIIVCPGKLISVDDNESADAVRVR